MFLKRVAAWPAMGHRGKAENNTPRREAGHSCHTQLPAGGVLWELWAWAHGSSPTHQFCALGKDLPTPSPALICENW